MGVIELKIDCRKLSGRYKSFFLSSFLSSFLIGGDGDFFNGDGSGIEEALLSVFFTGKQGSVLVEF